MSAGRLATNAMLRIRAASLPNELPLANSAMTAKIKTPITAMK